MKKNKITNDGSFFGLAILGAAALGGVILWRRQQDGGTMPALYSPTTGSTADTGTYSPPPFSVGGHYTKGLVLPGSGSNNTPSSALDTNGTGAGVSVGHYNLGYTYK